MAAPLGIHGRNNWRVARARFEPRLYLAWNRNGITNVSWRSDMPPGGDGKAVRSTAVSTALSRIASSLGDVTCALMTFPDGEIVKVTVATPRRPRPSGLFFASALRTSA